MTCKFCEANGDGHDLDVLIFMHQWRVSYPWISGCIERSARLRLIYLILS